MLFSITIKLAFLPLTLSIPLAPRAASEIEAGIRQLQSDIATLEGTLSGFKANDILSGFTALQIQSNTKAIENDLQSLTSASDNTEDLNSDDTGTVATAVVNLSPNIKDLLNDIVEKKPAFATAVLLVGDLSQTVEASLTKQKRLSDDFAAALIPKLAEPYRDYAPLITNQISGYFDIAIAAFQSCTGVICLPLIPS